MTVKELLSRIDSAELSEWIAYARLEPFGPLQDDLRAGITVSTLANVNRSKSSRVFHPHDFMPSLRAEDRRQHPPVQKIKGFLKAMAGKRK